MPKLPVLNSKELLKILKKAGYTEVRQTGSHKIMFNRELNRTIPVPMHNKDLGKGLLRSIINQMSITVDYLINLMS